MLSRSWHFLQFFLILSIFAAGILSDRTDAADSPTDDQAYFESFTSFRIASTDTIELDMRSVIPTYRHWMALTYVADRLGIQHLYFSPQEGGTATELARVDLMQFDRILQALEVSVHGFESNPEEEIVYWRGRADRSFHLHLLGPEEDVQTESKNFYMLESDQVQLDELNTLVQERDHLIVMFPPRSEKQSQSDLRFQPKGNPLKKWKQTSFEHQVVRGKDQRVVHFYQGTGAFQGKTLTLIELPDAGDLPGGASTMTASSYEFAVSQGYFPEGDPLHDEVYNPENQSNFFRQTIPFLEEDPSVRRKLVHAARELLHHHKSVFKNRTMVAAIGVTTLTLLRLIVQKRIVNRNGVRTLAQGLRRALRTPGLKRILFRTKNRLILPGTGMFVHSKDLLIFLKHADVILLMSFLAWDTFRILKSLRADWQLANPDRFFGDRKLYHQIKQYYERLLRGNPQLALSTVRSRRGLGLQGDEMRVQLVDTHIKLDWKILTGIRRYLDGRHKPYHLSATVRWYDPYLNIFELIQILAPEDQKTFKKVHQIVDGNRAFLSNFLMELIHEDEDALERWEAFTTRRYFYQMLTDEAPPLEIHQGFPARKAAFMEETGNTFRRIKSQALLSKKQQIYLKEILADFYTITMMVQRDPALAGNKHFWRTILNYSITNRSYGRLQLKKRSHRLELAVKLPILCRLLQAFFPDLFSGRTIWFEGKKLAVFGDADRPVEFHPLISRTRHTENWLVMLENQLVTFIKRFQAWFVLEEKPRVENQFEYLSEKSSAYRGLGNVVNEAGQTRARSRLQESAIDPPARLRSAVVQLRRMRVPRSTRQILKRLFRHFSQEIERYHRLLEESSFELSMIKALSPEAGDDPDKLMGFDQAVDHLRSLQLELQELKGKRAGLIQIMSGNVDVEKVHLFNQAALVDALATRFELDDFTKRALTWGPCRRILSRFQ